MNGRAAAAMMALAWLAGAQQGWAQPTLRPTPPPLVGAQLEPWYLSGEPITHLGHFYYPAGPQVYFNPYEMIRSGFFHGVPLYTRTTLEPGSIVYVPVGGGVLQPYERRRDRELAGTTGSRAPSFPVTRDHEVTDPGLPQAPGPPMLTGTYPAVDSASPAWAPERPIVAEARHGLPGHAVIGTGARPLGLNAIFIQFRGQRWVSAGPPRALGAELARIGEHHGFPVYASGRPARTIYLPLGAHLPGLVVPYTRR